jgi:hypothetical protein
MDGRGLPQQRQGVERGTRRFARAVPSDSDSRSDCLAAPFLWNEQDRPAAVHREMLWQVVPRVKWILAIFRRRDNQVGCPTLRDDIPESVGVFGRPAPPLMGNTEVVRGLVKSSLALLGLAPLPLGMPAENVAGDAAINFNLNGIVRADKECAMFLGELGGR